MKKALKIKVSGKLQGVGYRAFVQKQAQSLGIEGTVQNTDDGQGVVIHVAGQADKLDNLIDLLYKGTSSSKISNLAVEPMISEKDFRGVFRIIGD